LKQLVVFCEGPTEQGFCKQVLGPHLYQQTQSVCLTLAVGDRQGRHVYGVTKYVRLKRFIENSLKQRKSPDVLFTSMVDLYGLPHDFPGKDGAMRNPNYPWPYVESLEQAWADDIADTRFIPYLQLHEFEALLFVEPEAFEIAVDDAADTIAAMRATAAKFNSVEKINDDPTTAPSKRIIDLLPEYAGLKPKSGPDIAELIGIERLRVACQHFDRWISTLESRLSEEA